MSHQREPSFPEGEVELWGGPGGGQGNFGGGRGNFRVTFGLFIYNPHCQHYRPNFDDDFSNKSGNELPTLTLPESMFGNVWLAESLQYLKVQKIAEILFTD